MTGKQVRATELEGGLIEGDPNGVKGSLENYSCGSKTKIVIVGLGMVGISFVWVYLEKLSEFC